MQRAIHKHALMHTTEKWGIKPEVVEGEGFFCQLTWLSQR